MIKRIVSKSVLLWLVVMLTSFILVSLVLDDVLTPLVIDQYTEEMRDYLETTEIVQSELVLPDRTVILSQTSEVTEDVQMMTNHLAILSGDTFLFVESEDVIALTPYQLITQRVNRYQELSLYSLLFVYLAIGLVYGFVRGRFKRALTPFRHQALAYATFDFSERVQNHHSITDELSLSFNRMARQLSQRLGLLEQRNQIFNRVLDAMRDGVLAININNTVLVSNKQAEALLNHIQSETSLVEVKLPADWDEPMKNVMVTRSTEQKAVTMFGRNVLLIFAPLIKEEEVVGVVIISRDVTEEVQLNELRNLFVANVSHELRTPISLLQGYSEAIVDGVTDTIEDQQELARVILDESKRMGRLVNDLLDLAKVKSGQLELSKESYQVSTFVERLTSKFSHKAAAKHVQVIADVDTTLESLIFDYDRLEQVFTNLIDNALRYTEDGTITLRVRKGLRTVIFEVIDTGIGMEEANLPFLFERFYKADKSRTRNKSGTGLGLAIAKEIVEAHNGTIAVSSEIGKGTTFTIHLPNDF